MGIQERTRTDVESRIGPSRTESEQATELSPTEIHDLLADRRRRFVLYYLVGCEYAASVEEITEQVAVWETETQAAEVPSEYYEDVHISMVHHHLPKLVDMGAVDHDEDSDLVTLADGTKRLKIKLYLAAEREHRDR